MNVLTRAATSALAGGRATNGVLILMIAILAGCAGVDGTIQPRHFQFVDVIPHTGPGPGGWRAACVRAYIKRGRTEQYDVCEFGVEVPIETVDGRISVELAQRNSAYVANLVARKVLSKATHATPIAMLCIQFRREYDTALGAAMSGSRVKSMCHPLTTPVTWGKP